MTPTYRQVHVLLKEERGPASTHLCIVCGDTARDWAYQHDAVEELSTSDGRKYSADPEDYAPMCRGCHQRFDNGRGAFRGWKTAWVNPSPTFLANNAAAARRNGHVAREKLALLKTDPVEAARISERQSAGAKSGGCFRLRRCLDCGREMNAAVMGRHQKIQGHSGYEEVGQ